MVLYVALGFTSVAAAVIVDWGDGDCNTDTPGVDTVDYVGALNGASGTYLRDGWVLTANHVGVGDIVLEGQIYRPIPGTDKRLETSLGKPADLRLFKVYPTPTLPPKNVRSTSVEIGEIVLMIGNGRDRGTPITFDPFGPDVDPDVLEGWLWASTQTVRWGLNEVHRYSNYQVLGTRVFMTQFDDVDPILFESQAASGDSGGGVFSYSPNGIELVGIMISVSLEFGQAFNSSIFTNETIIARLDVYADQINDHIAVPEPMGGLACGLMMLGLFASRASRASRSQRQRRASIRSTPVTGAEPRR